MFRCSQNKKSSLKETSLLNINLQQFVGEQLKVANDLVKEEGLPNENILGQLKQLPKGFEDTIAQWAEKVIMKRFWNIFDKIKLWWWLTTHC